LDLKTRRQTIRVVTYNIHRCCGMDRRVRPGRIVDVLGEIDADIIALQEVLRVDGWNRESDQARFIAEELRFNFVFGATRRLKGGRHGNAVLTRFPIQIHRNYDISAGGRHPRGCLRADIKVGRSTLHVFNVHFGTAFFEHQEQARRLFDDRIVSDDELIGSRIVLGDFNEWLPGPVSKTLRSHLECADIRRHLQRSRTYPGMLPLLHLDHIYFDRSLKLEALHLHKQRNAIIASDHLPLAADFHLERSSRSLPLQVGPPVRAPMLHG
jgi:endonuclease/exonuclease/phosphatase family metal-dependent hydrolase